jgi:molecular chaperone GrpE
MENKESASTTSLEKETNPDTATTPATDTDQASGGSPGPESAASAKSFTEEEVLHLMADFSEAQEKLNKATEERKLIYDQLLRRQSEFENYRKRVDRERQDFATRTRGDIVSTLLPILDNLERALLSADRPDVEAAEESIITGIKLIHRQFVDVLAGLGLAPIKAMGEPFDPNLHEAVSTQATNDVPENTILAELQRGYKIGDRLLRPSMVKVSVRG